MKRISKIIELLLLVCGISFCLFGCNSNVMHYNTELYDSAVEWIKEDFQNDNPIKTYGFMGEDNENDYPSSRTFIISDCGEFERIFVDDFSEFEVDFDKEMIIVYTFGTVYRLPAKITNIKLKNKILTIDFKIETIPGAGSAEIPYQRWFVVKLDKLNILSVEFEEH